MDNEKLIKVLLNHTKSDIDITEESNLKEDLTIDSLTMINLILEIEEVFNIEVPDDELTEENFSTVESLNKLIVKCKFGKGVYNNE